MRKVSGVGINDLGIMNQAYRPWVNMLNRCYKSTRDTYRGCEVCDDWKLFSKFSKWFFETKPNLKWQLDKDFLGDGKLYSPETCCWLPSHINNMFSDGNCKDTMMKGIKQSPYGFELKMSLKGKMKHVGTFKTLQDAIAKRRQVKLDYIRSELQCHIDAGLIPSSILDICLNKIV